MMCVWSYEGMRGVKRRYSVARLIFPFAFATLWSSTIVAFLFKVRRCVQIEYNDCCSATLSYVERR